MKNKKQLIIFLVLFISLSFAVGIYGQKKKVLTIKKITVGTKGSLAIEAGLIFKLGDVKPVARVEFYLLDDNLETILKNAGIQSDGSISLVFSFVEWKKYNDLYPEKYTEAQNAIKPHIIATITTDFSGKGEFTSVKTGKYYLMGVGGTSKESVIWNMPVEIKTGKQSVTLDNNNAAEIF